LKKVYLCQVIGFDNRLKGLAPATDLIALAASANKAKKELRDG
jgi:hypothetical protein